MPLAETLVDLFPGSSLDTGKWTLGSYGTVVIGSGVCTITTGLTFGGIDSGFLYTFEDSYIMCEVLGVPNLVGTFTAAAIGVLNGGSTNSYIEIGLNPFDATQLAASDVDGAGNYTLLATVTYNSTTMRWWRLREAAGTTFFEYGPDGTSWTTLHSFATPSYATGNAVNIFAYSGRIDTSDSALVIDNFNNPPAGGTEVFGTAVGAWGGWTATAEGMGIHPAAAPEGGLVIGSPLAHIGSSYMGAPDVIVNVVTGTAAGAWGAWSGAASGVVSKIGTAAGSWGGWSATASGNVIRFGTLAGSWGAWVGTANGSVQRFGTAAGSWGGWSATLSATAERFGTASGAWGGWSGTANGTVIVPATAVGAWGGWTGTALGEVDPGTPDPEEVFGTAVGNWGGWSGSASGTRVVVAAAAGAWGSWSATVSGVVTVVGDGQANWGGWSGSATGLVSKTGTAQGIWGGWNGQASAVRTVLGTAQGLWGAWVGTIVVTGIAQGILVQTVTIEYLEQVIDIETTDQVTEQALVQVVTVEHLAQTIQLYDQTGQNIIMG